MGEFSEMRSRIQGEYREVVERRVYTVTGVCARVCVCVPVISGVFMLVCVCRCGSGVGVGVSVTVRVRKCVPLSMQVWVAVLSCTLMCTSSTHLKLGVTCKQYRP
jgi:hypothetical protein